MSKEVKVGDRVRVIGFAVHFNKEAGMTQFLAMRGEPVFIVQEVRDGEWIDLGDWTTHLRNVEIKECGEGNHEFQPKQWECAHPGNHTSECSQVKYCARCGAKKMVEVCWCGESSGVMKHQYDRWYDGKRVFEHPFQPNRRKAERRTFSLIDHMTLCGRTYKAVERRKADRRKR